MGAKELQIEEKERGAERLMLDESARLRPNGWSSVEVRIVNLSSTGFRAECEAKLLIGGCVSMDMPGLGWIDAQVEWQRDGAFGAKFLQSIDMADCAWSPRARKPQLAELLVARAAARKAGRMAAERKIKQSILQALPMRGNEGNAR